MAPTLLLRPLIALASLLLAAPGVARASGCGGLVRAGEITVPVRHEGRDRPVHLYAPAGHRSDRSLPLLLNLHGSGSTGRAQFALSGLRAAADRHGVLVASPDAGIPAREGYLWNVPGVPTVAGAVPGADAPDDTGYLVAVVDAVAAALCVDRTRVYATGLSGGGRMASWLACARADRFAAIAPVVGLRAGRARAGDPARVDEASCRPSRPVAVIAFAGAKDRTNPLAGGEGPRWGYSMAEALRRWAALDRCRRAEPIVRIDGRRYRQRYAGCAGGTAVEAMVDVEGGHDWRVADDDAMLRFLLAHRLPAASAAGVKTILFVGNSFTFGANSAVQTLNAGRVTDLNGDGVGGVPGLFKRFTEQAGLRYDVALETAPGRPLGWHLADRRAVLDRRWDHVVLQEYSTLDPDRPGDPARFTADAAALARLFAARNPAVKVHLYATWSRPDLVLLPGSRWSGEPLPAMANELRRAYDRAAQDIGARADVAPVGQAFTCAIRAGAADADPYDGIDPGRSPLWSSDQYHASAQGYYLAALTLFGDVTGRDPRSLGPSEAAAAELGFSRRETTALQAAAHTALSTDGRCGA